MSLVPVPVYFGLLVIVQFQQSPFSLLLGRSTLPNFHLPAIQQVTSISLCSNEYPMLLYPYVYINCVYMSKEVDVGLFEYGILIIFLGLKSHVKTTGNLVQVHAHAIVYLCSFVIGEVSL